MHGPRPFTSITDAAIAACTTPAERSVVLDLFSRARLCYNDPVSRSRKGSFNG